MEVRLLKLSDDKNLPTTPKDIIAAHLGYLAVNGAVTFSTGIPIASRPDYVLIVTENINPEYYWCHVIDYDFTKRGIYISPKAPMNDYSPIMFKDDNVSWLQFDSMLKLPKDLVDIFLERPKEIADFINFFRPNNKIVTK